MSLCQILVLLCTCFAMSTKMAANCKPTIVSIAQGYNPNENETIVARVQQMAGFIQVVLQPWFRMKPRIIDFGGCVVLRRNV